MSKRNTAFYIETLVMVALLLVVSLLIMRLYGAARHDSRQAELLTEAVSLAENTAEYAADSGSADELCGRLSGQIDGDMITAAYNESLTPDADGPLQVTVSWDEQGTLAQVTITVSSAGEELYTLETAVYLGVTA